MPPDEELEALLQEADTAIESCQRLREARERAAEIDEYIPKVNERVEKLAAIDPENAVLAKLRKKLADLTSERSELTELIENSNGEIKEVSLVKSDRSLSATMQEVESDREARQREYDEQQAKTQAMVDSILEFKAALYFEKEEEKGGDVEESRVRELVERILYVTEGKVLEHDSFIKLVEPFAECFASGKAFRELRKKLRSEGVDFSAFNEDDEPDVAGTSEDKLYEKLEGQTAAFLGGDRIGSQLDKYKDHFKFKEIVWCSATKHTEVASMIEQIASGSIDIVFCIVDFCGHTPEANVKEACKKADIPFISVTGGYGLSRFAQSYMKYFGMPV